MGWFDRLMGVEAPAIMTEEDARDPVELAEEKPSLRELGATGMTSYGSFGIIEYNPELRGIRGIKTYDQMRRSDAQIRATLRLVKTPIISAQWYMQPASSSDLDTEIADFAWWALNHMRQPFIEFLWESLLMLDYGYYAFEKVFTMDTWKNAQKQRPREKEVVRWEAFAPRHPVHVDRFEFNPNGTVNHIVFNRVDGKTNFSSQVDIPVQKLLLFTLDREGGDPQGTSILRSAYKHWYYKENLYKVDAIQKERHGIGIPKIKLPPGFTNEDKNFANELGRNLRTNEKAYVTLPPGWDVEFIAMNTGVVDVLKSAEHHDLMIARNVLGQFMNLGSTTSGSRALGSSQMEIFMKALRYVSDIVRMNINQDAIPDLIRYNYGSRITNFPELRVRRVGETADWRAFSVAMRNLVEPGILTPTPDLEQWTRDQMDLPLGGDDVTERDVDQRTKRDIALQKAEEPAPSPNGEVRKDQNADGSRQGSLTGGPKE